MVFSSNLFLFLFLPLVLFGYHLVIQRYRNHFLFGVSCFFYFWGSGQIAMLFIAAVFVNYYLSVLIDRSSSKIGKMIFVGGVFYNLSWLFYFKYYNFFYAEVARLFKVLGITLPEHIMIALPIGISFYTFQSIAYLFEVYSKQHKPARSWLDYGTYLALFPHVVAGPIVRYSDIKGEIESRSGGIEMFFEGIWRFALGMGKKVIIANTVGAVADQIFGLPTTELSTSKAWLGLVCYTFQIYYDFSGYSDMAIGLAKMFAFHFPENFNQPYRADTITEFWRRWHMTLSSWFRDFVYIPLGGNRCGRIRTYFNLWAVFFLCGLWHGASWTFVIWGLWHGFWLVIERIAKNRFNYVGKGIASRAVTLILVMIGWVFFRTESFGDAMMFLSRMFNINNTPLSFEYYTIWYYLDPKVIVSLVFATLFALLPIEQFKKVQILEPIATLSRGSAAILLLVFSAAILSKSGFNPFIYFRF